jgi:penicillin G amidase
MNLSRLIFRLLLGRRLPVTQGKLAVNGCDGLITIHRDRWGIPLIDATTDPDAHYAIGFCHGQDRAFQLEILQRVATGTLSELIGAVTVHHDRLSRRIGFLRAARQQLPLLAADVRQNLEAYARGINDGRTVGCPRPPHEFALLRGQRVSWEATHTLAIIKVLSFSLCSNWDAELARWRILCDDGPEALRALDPTYPEWHPVTAMPVGCAESMPEFLTRDLDEFFQFIRPGGGSNNWVLAGSRTATGRPLLANDPHLDASLPAHWYLARVQGPRGTFAGATFVGGPSFLVAHNGLACWGLTAGLTDNTDLFQEEIGPDGKSVRRGNGYEPCEIVDEEIRIKGAAPVLERVLITPRGPIVSPSLPDATGPHERWALSLRAAWLDPVPIGGLVRMDSISSFEEFRRAFAQWPASAQNMVYADTTGKIGWQLIGRTPRRKAGCGALPLPGWDERTGWETEPIPYDDLPHLEDPECGFIASANTPPWMWTNGDAKPFLGVDFIDGYRLRSIVRNLHSRTDWAIASTMQLQMDQHAVAWEELRDLVLSVPTTNPATEQAVKLLQGWNGDTSAASTAAAVYEFFLVEMVTRLVTAKAPKSAAYALGKGLSLINSHNFFCFRRTAHLVRLLREQPAGWFPRPWSDEISESLAKVVRELTALRGPDPARWAWGEIRPLTMHHPLTRAGALGRALGSVFNLGPIPLGGDADVINQAAVMPLHPLAHTDNIASLRAVFDVGEWQNSRFVLPGGQSGNPLSPHYGDLFALWQKGEGVPIAFTAEEVNAAAVETLELRPGKG